MTTLDDETKAAVKEAVRPKPVFRQTEESIREERLSSTDPNLQNIPIRTEEGRRIRRAFIVGDRFETLLTADYSQIEMRIMAHLSKDQALIDTVVNNEYWHRRSAWDKEQKKLAEAEQ